MKARLPILVCTMLVGASIWTTPLLARPEGEATMEVQHGASNNVSTTLQIKVKKVGKDEYTQIGVPGISKSDGVAGKAAKIAARLGTESGLSVTPDGSNSAKFKVKGATDIQIDTARNKTGETDLMALSMNTWDSGGFATATASFDNPMFSTFDADGMPTTFTAGLVTDAGRFSAQISSAELGGITSGDVICATLENMLTPYASAHGVTIQNTGTSLEFTFDRASSQVEAGVIFGSTALEPGVGGGIAYVSVPEPASAGMLAISALGLLPRRRVAQRH